MSLYSPELQLLESIYAASEQGKNGAVLSQRELAQDAGISLGLTNTLLKRFVERGWIKLMHVDGRKLQYALTPSGMEEIAERAVDYFARAARYSELYRHKVERFVKGARGQGYSALLLLGPVELDFIFEYACLKHGLAFYKNRRLCLAEMARREAELVVICKEATESVNECRTSGRENAGGKNAGRGLGVSEEVFPPGVPVVRFSQILSFSGEAGGRGAM